MRYREFIKSILPPFIMENLHRIRKRLPGVKPEWELAQAGWDTYGITGNSGWNNPELISTLRTRFIQCRDVLKSGTFDMPNHEDAPGAGPSAHMTFFAMNFAYALARSASGGKTVRMLDFGGGLGLYAIIAKTLFPDLALDYCGYDLAPVIHEARQLQPDLLFTDSEDCLKGSYDFVHAGSSLQYCRNWDETLRGLSEATGKFCLISRIPMCRKKSSCVIVQRPAIYPAEYACWCFSHDEFLGAALARGFVLEREFFTGVTIPVNGMKDVVSIRSFLFRKDSDR